MAQLWTALLYEYLLLCTEVKYPVKPRLPLRSVADVSCCSVASEAYSPSHLLLMYTVTTYSLPKITLHTLRTYYISGFESGHTRHTMVVASAGAAVWKMNTLYI